jgi:retinol dehydrogenase 12
MQQSPAARIVHVSSRAHRRAQRINFLDFNYSRHYAAWEVYGHSKLANILFSNELARRLDGGTVTTNALHPGLVATSFGGNNGFLARAAMRIAKRFLLSAEEGAKTVVYLASALEVQGVTGKYFVEQQAQDPFPTATDIVEARRLWELSERLLDGYI